MSEKIGILICSMNKLHIKALNLSTGRFALIASSL